MARRKNMKLRNPFIFNGYAGPDYFCDRTDETKELLSNLQNGRDTVLISPRRMVELALVYV
jgi:hypothetical protein